MEMNQPLDSSMDTVLLSPEMKGYLRTASVWSKFLAILGFIFTGFLLLGGIAGALFFGAMGSELQGMDDMGGAPGFGALFALGPATILLIYAIMAFIIFLPCLYLYRFSANMDRALAADDDTRLTLSFQNLKSFFKFNGIVVIATVALYIIGLLSMGTLMATL